MGDITAKVYRQGDVLLREIDGKIDEVPRWGFEDKGMATLRIGGETGKVHEIQGHLFENPHRKDEQVIVLDATALLKHEEHGAMEIPAGTYQVSRVREYTDNSTRYGMD
ncbi:MAG: hypothetical protein M1351_02310 [Candidatus Thermoplasmatota archaeon]|nr:hypothetical protein [Candidatus Thermoplasmatota archaeon]